MQDLLQSALKAVNDVPPEVWAVIVETIVAALVASPLVVGLKKWLSIHSDKVMLSVTILMSMVTAALAYAVNDPVFSAWLIPVQGWLVFATTQPVYRFLVKPIINKIKSIIDEAIRLNVEVKSAAVPPTGLPHSEVK